ncbi:MAG: hypothetical protein ABI411_14525 [Tahibacter sp.]
MNTQTAKMITMGLAGVCGVFGIAAVLAALGAGRGYGWLNADGQAEPLQSVRRIDGEAVALPPEPEFADIQRRPIFNEDRKPTPIVAVDPNAGSTLPAVPLNVTLTGVMLTESGLRLAMFQDNAKNEPVSLRIGMPLPGDQQVWTLTEIQPRKVVFKNATDETSEIELQVAPGALVPPVPRGGPQPPGSPAMPPTMPPGGSGSATAPPNGEPPDRAAELQRRIEERRREMREQAEKLRQQQDQKK